MSDTPQLGLIDAARRFGVPVRVLRRAIRAGTLPAVPHLSATSVLPETWMREAEATIEASPHHLKPAALQRVPAFARYEGTSAWRKYTDRVREYAQHRKTAAAQG